MIMGFNKRSSQHRTPSTRLAISTVVANFLGVLSTPIFSQLPWKQSQRVSVLFFPKSSSPPTPCRNSTIY